MSKGWECPKCGGCYSPSVEECSRCSPQKDSTPIEKFETDFRKWIDLSRQNLLVHCCACTGICAHTGPASYCNNHKAIYQPSSCYPHRF